MWPNFKPSSCLLLLVPLISRLQSPIYSHVFLSDILHCSPSIKPNVHEATKVALHLKFGEYRLEIYGWQIHVWEVWDWKIQVWQIHISKIYPLKAFVAMFSTKFWIMKRRPRWKSKVERSALAHFIRDAVCRLLPNLPTRGKLQGTQSPIPSLCYVISSCFGIRYQFRSAAYLHICLALDEFHECLLYTISSISHTDISTFQHIQYHDPVPCYLLKDGNHPRRKPVSNEFLEYIERMDTWEHSITPQCSLTTYNHTGHTLQHFTLLPFYHFTYI